MKKVELQFIDSLYFMTTTMTTVGYGDKKGESEKERILLCIIMFFGLAMFTLISNQVLSLKKTLRVEDLVKDNNENIIDYLY